jgi:hypothetical protein
MGDPPVLSVQPHVGDLHGTLKLEVDDAVLPRGVGEEVLGIPTGALKVAAAAGVERFEADGVREIDLLPFAVLQRAELVIRGDRDCRLTSVFAIEAPALVEVEVQPCDWVAGPLVAALEQGSRWLFGPPHQRVKNRVGRASAPERKTPQRIGILFVWSCR